MDWIGRKRLELTFNGHESPIVELVLEARLKLCHEYWEGN